MLDSHFGHVPIVWPVTTDLLTASQAATAVGVNRRTIMRWAESGRLPVALKLPGDTGTTLFASADVGRLAAERRAGLEAELASLSPASSSEGEQA